MNQPSTTTTTLQSLPDDLLLRCFARVSRFYYPTLSLVSKSFRSLIASPELYRIRSSLNRTENCLYVCFRYPPDPNPLWFTLCLKPDRTMMSNTSSGIVLAPTSVPYGAPAHWSGVVSVGSDVYNVGGHVENASSSSIEAQCMWMEPKSWEKVLDRKIYLTRNKNDSDLEVFDPKTRIWKLEEPNNVPFLSLVLVKKTYKNGLCKNNGLGYKPKEGQWKRFWGENSSWGWFSGCVVDNVVDNVLYRYRSGKFWYDTIAGWAKLKSIRGLPKFVSYGCVQLVDYGGKLAVLWAELMPIGGHKDKMFWCAVIALKRRKSGSIRGEVEWCDMVGTVPKTYQLEYALNAIV
ncbi:unnamed protein product [Cochlearia groenlandica]